VDEDLSLIERTKKLIARVDALHRATKEIRNELALYGRALQQQLSALEEAVGGGELSAASDDAPIPLVGDDPPAPPRSAARETRAPANGDVDSPKTAPGRPERRKSFRRQGPPVPLFLSYSKSGDDPFKGWINDCSQNGIGVTVDWALPVSSILTVRPVNAPARLKWFQIEVRNCRKSRDRWLLGCKFINQLAPEDLDLFEP
jgi:hypothetical protein